MTNIEGLDKLKKKLKDIGDKAKELDGQDVPISELLTSSFLTKYTHFSSIDELLQASGFKVESRDDFKAIPDDKWDEYIHPISNFKGWQDMINKATEEWTARKLGI